MNKQKLIFASIGGLVLLAVSFGLNLQKSGAVHAQSAPVQNVKQAEPDKETNDDAVSPKQAETTQDTPDVNEKEQSGTDIDTVNDNAK